MPGATTTISAWPWPACRRPLPPMAAHKDGYTVGAGLEYMFAPNWSAKAEYQYYNFGSTTFTGGPAPIVGTRFRDDEHTVKVRHKLPLRLGRPGRRAVLRRVFVRFEIATAMRGGWRTRGAKK